MTTQIHKRKLDDVIDARGGYLGLDCDWCGFPGLDDADEDGGSAVYTIDDDGPVYCSRSCANAALRAACSWVEPTDAPDRVADADLLCPEGGVA